MIFSQTWLRDGQHPSYIHHLSPLLHLFWSRKQYFHPIFKPLTSMSHTLVQWPSFQANLRQCTLACHTCRSCLTPFPSCPQTGEGTAVKEEECKQVRLPSYLHKPVGSFVDRTPAELRAHQTISFRAWCLAIGPGAFLQTMAWSAWVSTSAPQRHLCGTHKLMPNLMPHMWTALSSRAAVHSSP